MEEEPRVVEGYFKVGGESFGVHHFKPQTRALCEEPLNHADFRDDGEEPRCTRRAVDETEQIPQVIRSDRTLCVGVDEPVEESVTKKLGLFEGIVVGKGRAQGGLQHA